jgi:hypothetical protein
MPSSALSLPSRVKLGQYSDVSPGNLSSDVDCGGSLSLGMDISVGLPSRSESHRTRLGNFHVS